MSQLTQAVDVHASDLDPIYVKLDVFSSTFLNLVRKTE